MKEKTDTHPSYGMIQVNSFSGRRTFFGSSIQHGGGISITICEGDNIRKINNDWYHAGKELIRVEMSYTQFAEMITASMNTQGVPCSIRRIDGKSIPAPPFINKRTLYQQEFKEHMQEQAERLDSLVARVDELSKKKGTINKKEINEVKKLVDKAHQDLNDNTHYIANCWNEQLEKTTTEAKGEIEGFVDNKVRQLGIKGLQELSEISLLETSEMDEIANEDN
jgi:hypothetical protein